MEKNMLDPELNEFEMASPAVVRQAARDFAAALSETPQFAAFEVAAERLSKDAVAQKAIEAFQTKQGSLQMLLRLNAVSPEDKAELERLRLAFVSEPSVQAYFEAQTELTTLCQATGDLISQTIGLNYSAACSSGCCG
jgi:cell fate (sporulation/competence/biofilm development) regulator YlbF (YheA/YmcA/DUF963 family)